MRKKRYGECQLCGRTAKLTDDHVPPRCLFPSGTILPKVRACRDCNNASSGDDEYFRAALALRQDVQSNGVVNQLLPEIVRGVQLGGPRGHTGSIIRTMRDVELRTPAGLFIGMGGTYMPEDERMRRVVGRTIRGLFAIETGQRLPDTHAVSVFVVAHIDPSSPKAVRGVLETHRYAMDGKLVAVHPEVFAYAARLAAEGTADSVWTLVFYRKIPVIAVTGERSRFPSGMQVF